MVKEYVYGKVEECLFRAKFNKVFNEYYKTENIEKLLDNKIVTDKFSEIFTNYINLKHKGRILENLMNNEERIRHSYLKLKTYTKLKKLYIEENKKTDDYKLIKEYIKTNLRKQSKHIVREKIDEEEVGKYVEFVLNQ